VAVARYLQRDRAGVGDHCLLAIAVAPVARLLAGKMMILRCRQTADAATQALGWLNDNGAQVRQEQESP
jgi:hypothetical protein